MDHLRMRTWAEINLDNLAHNYISIKSSLPEGTEIFGVVKANAYGHGAVQISKKLISLGCGYLAVATVFEGLELREAGIDAPILVLGPTMPALATLAADYGLTLMVGNIETALEIQKNIDSKLLKIHIKLDTGMCRAGFDVLSPKTLPEICEIVLQESLITEGVFTHFAVSDNQADPFTKLQFDRFQNTIKLIEEKTGHSFKIRHCANSGAVVNYGKHMSLDMVRPGISLYGLHPGRDGGGISLLPVMTLKTRIASITERRSGDTISYDRTYTYDKVGRSALIPIGYADGLHRLLSNKLNVTIDGVRAPQVGRICMDMCVVDITHIPSAKVGDVVTVFGEGAESVCDLAAAAGTISYELLCAVSGRVSRCYT